MSSEATFLDNELVGIAESELESLSTPFPIGNCVSLLASGGRIMRPTAIMKDWVDNRL